MTNTIFEALNLRYQWEEIVKEYKLDDERKVGTVDNLKWFVTYGKSSNRFRKDFDHSVVIAKEILGLRDEKANLSGVHG